MLKLADRVVKIKSICEQRDIYIPSTLLFGGKWWLVWHRLNVMEISQGWKYFS